MLVIQIPTIVFVSVMAAFFAILYISLRITAWHYQSKIFKFKIQAAKLAGDPPQDSGPGRMLVKRGKQWRWEGGDQDDRQM